jgi:hypothetical protein
MQLIETTLKKLLAEFLDFRETNVDTNTQMPATYNSPEEMEQAFEDWINELTHEWISFQDWEQLFKEGHDDT